MKKLSAFQKFDFQTWSEGKRFLINGAKYNEARGCVSLDVVIIQDNTDYADPGVTNLYEKFKVHCVNDTNQNDVGKYPLNAEIRFTKVGKCVVYGDFSSSLSVTAIVQVVGHEGK